MPRIHTLPLWLTCAALFVAGALCAGPRAAATEAEALSVPFEHALGDRYVLSILHATHQDGTLRRQERQELAVTVRSPMGAGWLIELRHTALVQGERRIDLRERTDTNAALLDELGGGILRIEVDARGTALRVLNWKQVAAALERTANRLVAEHLARHGSTGGAAKRVRALIETSLARPVIEPILLADWNLVYAACGVRLSPARAERREVQVPRADGGAPLRAVDRRLLTEAYDAHGAARFLQFESEVRFGLDGRISFGAAQADLTEHTRIRYDLRTARLAGERIRTLRTAAHETVEVVRFSETELPTAGAPTAVPTARPAPRPEVSRPGAARPIILAVGGPDGPAASAAELASVPAAGR